jgi:hypothetical protein
MCTGTCHDRWWECGGPPYGYGYGGRECGYTGTWFLYLQLAVNDIHQREEQTRHRRVEDPGRGHWCSHTGGGIDKRMGAPFGFVGYVYLCDIVPP